MHAFDATTGAALWTRAPGCVCFSECRIYKVIDSAAADPSYVMQYHCRSLEEYHRYRDNFAPALQKEHSGRFAGRFRGARQLLEEVGDGTLAQEG